MYRSLMVAKPTWTRERLPALLAGVGSARYRFSERAEVLTAQIERDRRMRRQPNLVVMGAVIADENDCGSLH